MSTASSSATKLTLVFINFLLFAVGIACLVIGAWVLLYREQLRVLTLLAFAANHLGLLQNAAILIIASGVALVALSIMGCLATYRASKCLQVLYIGLIILACLVTIAAVVISFLFRAQVQDKLLNELSSKLKTEYQGFTTSKIDFSQAFDYAQVEFDCCGVLNYTEFSGAKNWTVVQSAVIPLSCCVLTDKNAYIKERFYTLQDRNCVLAPTSTNSHIDQPCYEPLKTWMEQETFLVIGIAAANIVLQVLAIIFMAVLMKGQTKNDNLLYRGTLT